MHDPQVMIIALIVIIVGVLRALPHFLHHQQIRWLLDERRLLIEKGVTDLPSLQLPEIKRRDSLTNLKAGVLLLFVGSASTALVYYQFRGKLESREFLYQGGITQLDFSVLLAAAGLALVIIHFFARAYERRAHRSENGESIQQSKAEE